MTEKKHNPYANFKYKDCKPIYIPEDQVRSDQMERLTNSDTFCMVPWLHIHGFPDGRAYPCCLSLIDHPIGNMKTHSLKEIWNQDPYKQMRVNMLDNKSCKECVKCYEQEGHGFFSMRNSMNKNFGQHIGIIDQTKEDGTFEDFKMRYYDIRFSNFCNMRCRTCGSIFSSQWYDEEVKLYGPRNYPKIAYAGKDKDDMWNQMQEHIPHLDQIYFAGGEPLIMEEHYNVLTELVKREMFHVRLMYNTNFSELMLKDKDVLEYWKLFKTVGVGASIDASYARGEYLRKGTKWDKIVRNRERMLEVCPQVDFYVSSTVSIFNVLHVTDFHREWIEKGYVRPGDWNVNILQGPDRDRIDILPDEFKKQAIEKIQAHIDYINPIDRITRATSGFESAIAFMKNENPNRDKLLKEFFETTNKVDALRGEKFEDAFPELQGLRSMIKG